MTTVHHYWHNDRKTDLSKMRDDAQRRLKDKDFPERSVIHKHPYDKNCLAEAIAYDPDTHELFPPPQPVLFPNFGGSGL